MNIPYNLEKVRDIKLTETDLIEFEWDKKEMKEDIEKLKNKAEYIKKLEDLKTKKDGK